MAPNISPQSTHYALVIDAGSSGSRLQIYSWRDPDLERAEIVADVKETVWGRRGGRKWWWPPGYKGKGKEREGELERRALRRLVRVGKGVEGDGWVKRVEPGISATSPSNIPEYLAPMLQHALDQIPPSLHSTTPIYLYATAGMRLLPKKEQDAILEATCRILKSKYPFKLGESSTGGSCGEHIRVISGEEEGLWGWVAVNYLMDGFGHAPPYETTSAAPSPSSNLLPLAPLADPPQDSSQESVTPVDVAHHSPTFGFLDMGGASTQLAFSPSQLELVRSGFPEEDLREVSLRLLSGEVVDWPVFVASWLGYGTNRVRERYTDALITRASSSSADSSTPISDPCLPVGLRIQSPNNGPDLVGTGNFGSCLADLKPLLEHDMPCPTSHCLFAGLPTPHIDFEREDQRGFIGVSEYWYTASQVLGLGGVWDWGEWEQGMADFCKRDWEAIQRQVEDEQGWRGSQLELSRLQMQCFKGAWISNVLHDGIGIPRLFDKGGNETLTGGELGETNAEANRRARQKGLFQSMDEINQTAISWTLGKMVIEASKAVKPRSAEMEGFWKDHLPIIDFGRLGQRLEYAGVQVIWLYALVVLGMLLCCFSGIRRRLGIGKVVRKGRKSGSVPSSPSPKPWNWVIPWTKPEYSIEDGPIDISTSPKPASRPILSRLRLLALRVGHTVRRNLPIGGKHYSPLPMTSLDNGRRSPLGRTPSMPLVNSLSSQSAISYSQPPSPKMGSSGSGFFTPAFSSTLNIPAGRNGSASPTPDPFSLSSHASASASSVQVSPLPTPTMSSPPRIKSARSPRPRQGSAQLSDDSKGATSNGWNDPPSSMLSMSNGHGHTNGGAPARSPTNGHGHSLPAHMYTEGHTSGVLTPPATSEGGALSRQSSRVNLSEMGLAQRSSSRAGTPHGDFEDGM